MATTTAAFSRTVSTQIFLPAFREGRERGAKSNLDKLFSFKTSDKSKEQIFQTTGLGKPQSAGLLGDVHYLDMEEVGEVSWTHATWTLGAFLPQQLVEDSQYVNFTQEVAASISEGFNYIEEYLKNLPFDRATSSSYLMPDGYALASASRTNKAGRTIANLVTAMSPNWANIWANMAYFQYGMYDQKDLPYKGVPKYIMYHPRYEQSVSRALDGKVWEPGTADRNPQTLGQFNLEKVANRFLTTTTNWGIFDEKFPGDNYFWTRIKPTVSTEPGFDQYVLKWRCRARYSSGPRSGQHALIVGS
jgi:hypothetical protein